MNKIDAESLKKLRKNLPVGYSRVLAERTGYSQGMVMLVIQGHRNNYKILDAAILLAEETKQVILSKKEKIESL